MPKAQQKDEKDTEPSKQICGPDFSSSSVQVKWSRDVWVGNESENVEFLGVDTSFSTVDLEAIVSSVHERIYSGIILPATKDRMGNLFEGLIQHLLPWLTIGTLVFIPFFHEEN
jgi:hypothetical protein